MKSDKNNMLYITPSKKYITKLKLVLKVGSNSICIILAGQKPGAKTKNISCQSIMKNASTGIIRISPDNFITTNPSTLLELNEFTINATPGACNAPAIDISNTFQNVASGKNPVAKVITRVAINPNINATTSFTIT